MMRFTRVSRTVLKRKRQRKNIIATNGMHGMAQHKSVGGRKSLAGVLFDTWSDIRCDVLEGAQYNFDDCFVAVSILLDERPPCVDTIHAISP